MKKRKEEEQRKKAEERAIKQEQRARERAPRKKHRGPRQQRGSNLLLLEEREVPTLEVLDPQNFHEWPRVNRSMTTNVVFVMYEDDQSGKDWVACACGGWLHEECADDCIIDSD